MEYLAIDTNIIVKAFVDNETDHRDVLAFLHSRFGLALDSEGVIHKEYDNNAGKNQAFQKWWKRLFEKKAFFKVAGNLDKAHCDKLSSLGCHEPSDHVFLAVAYKTHKLLVSEDSDFGKGPKGSEPSNCNVLAYIQNNMKVLVLDAKEALNYLHSKREATA